MRTRHNLAVLALSLAAHLALLAAWLSTRPQLRLVEPPVMEVALIRPPPKPRARPPAAPERTAVRPRPARIAEPPPSPLPLPPAPSAPSPRLLTDEELLAGAKPNAAQLGADRDRTIIFHGWPRGCKPMSEHSNRPGPPCPVGGPDDRASRTLAEKDPGHSGFAAEARRKEAIEDYKNGPGTGGAYPGIRCTIFHKC
ncbi:hypothetical protein [Phenylobacterium sp.]|uniref:hypothetical protein n=1 Tax=Phenylobacterium sp. TaxID=1871053 RepID=UPI00356555A5